MKLKPSGQCSCFALFWYQSHKEQGLFYTYRVSNVRWLKIDKRFGFHGAIIENILWGYSAGNFSHGCSSSGLFKEFYILWGYSASNISHGCSSHFSWMQFAWSFLKDVSFTALLFKNTNSKIERGILKIIFVLVHVGSNRWIKADSRKSIMLCLKEKKPNL